MTVRFASPNASTLLGKDGSEYPTTTEGLITELRSLVGDSDQSTEILAAMGRLWNCADLNEVTSQLVHFHGNVRVQRLLKSAQWVFHKQDVAEWPGRGRQRPLYAIERALNTPTKFDERRC